MQKSTRVFPSVPVTFTGQSLISHAGVKVLTGFLDALGFGRLCDERLGKFVPAGARHRPGRVLGSLAARLAAGRRTRLRPGHPPVITPGSSVSCPRTRPCPDSSNAP